MLLAYNCLDATVIVKRFTTREIASCPVLGCDEEGSLPPMMRNTIRGILALALTAAATWLADKIVDQIFGPEEAEGSF